MRSSLASSFLLYLTLVMVACSSDGDDNASICFADDPVQDLPWLKTIIETHQGGQIDITIEQGKYQLRTVFTVTPCCMTCRLNMISPSVYTCEGKALGGVSFSDKRIKDRKVIWKTPEQEAECW